jgi:hypothetical protein
MDKPVPKCQTAIRILAAVSFDAAAYLFLWLIYVYSCNWETQTVGLYTTRVWEGNFPAWPVEFVGWIAILIAAINLSVLGFFWLLSSDS